MYVIQFKFYEDDDLEEMLLPVDKKQFSIDDVRAHSDPFYRECRAYGKLIEANLNGKVAVRCHGFLSLPANVENELKEKFHVELWDRSEDDYDMPVSKRQPLRAIVKDLIFSESDFTEKDIHRMLKHLKQLRKLGVYPMDLASRNYRGGLLVDFSAAITEPHYLFATRPRIAYKYKQEDLILFDMMIKEAGIKFPKSRALPDKQYREKLRDRKQTKPLAI